MRTKWQTAVFPASLLWKLQFFVLISSYSRHQKITFNSPYCSCKIFSSYYLLIKKRHRVYEITMLYVCVCECTCTNVSFCLPFQLSNQSAMTTLAKTLCHSRAHEPHTLSFTTDVNNVADQCIC